MGAILKIDAVRWPVLLIGSLALIYMGVKHIIPSPKEEKSVSEGKDDNSFLYGIKLTIPNTITIVIWANVFGALIASKRLIGMSDTIIYGLGCALSTVAFFAFISLIGSRLSGVFNDKLKRFINIFVGLFLIYFAVNMLLK